MAKRPIIFSAPMVRALLDGRKTQTRRVLKGVPDAPAMDNIAWPDRKLHSAPYVDAYCGAKRTFENPRGMTANWAYWTRDDRPGPLFKVGYVPGDRLWVREAHWLTEEGDCVPVAGNEEASADERKRPSIFMPRWASRLTLTVTDVRVQQLQEISEADARAEGAEPVLAHPNEMGLAGDGSYRDGFLDLWNSIHGPEAWDANPWVVAVTFTVERRNIDAGSESP